MGWKIFDYRCECGYEFESMEKSAEDEVTCPEVVTHALHGLPEVLCGKIAALIPSANLGWTNDKEKQNKMLRKRSLDHTRKEQKSGNMLSPKDLPKF